MLPTNKVSEGKKGSTTAEKKIESEGGTHRRTNRMKINPKKNAERTCQRGSTEKPGRIDDALGSFSDRYDLEES